MIHWATRRPAVVLATAVAILLAGAVSFTRLALATRTSIELPRLVVGATWPGASAELVETYITSPIEAAIQGVRGVHRTSSQSRDETAQLTVELEPKADVQLARLGILERLELLRSEFPPGAVAPTVSNYVPENLEEQPLLLFTVSGPYTAGTLQKLAIILEGVYARYSGGQHGKTDDAFEEFAKIVVRLAEAAEEAIAKLG